MPITKIKILEIITFKNMKDVSADLQEVVYGYGWKTFPTNKIILCLWCVTVD